MGLVLSMSGVANMPKASDVCNRMQSNFNANVTIEDKETTVMQQTATIASVRTTKSKSINVSIAVLLVALIP